MPKIIENPQKIILEHAKSILFTYGYEGLNIRKVAKDCSISVGTIYNYFQTKADLVIQIITDYWDEYFRSVEEISSSGLSLYEKLREIYTKLEKFVTLFHEVWMKMHSTAPQYTQRGQKDRNDSIASLISAMEKLVSEEFTRQGRTIDESLNPHEIALFIVSNFVTMTQLKQFEYESFEKMLRKILQ